MSERIRNIRDALRSGFDTQIAIGEKAFGLAEQRESRNFQLALEARRERLTREMQDKQISATAQLAKDRRDHDIELEGIRQENNRSNIYLSNHYNVSLEEMRHINNLERDALTRLAQLDDAAKAATAATAERSFELSKAELDSLRTQQTELFKLLDNDDYQGNQKLITDKLDAIGRSMSALRDKLGLPKNYFEIADSIPLAEEFFEWSSKDRTDLVLLAQEWKARGGGLTETLAISNEFKNFLSSNPEIKYPNETEENFIKRMLNTIAEMSVTGDPAPPPTPDVSDEESATTAQSVISAAENINVGEQRPRGADSLNIAITRVKSKANPVIESDEYINKILSNEISLFPPGSLELFVQSQSELLSLQSPPDFLSENFASSYAKRLMADPKYLISVYSGMLKDIEGRVTTTRPGRAGTSVQVTNPQLKEKADKLNQVISFLKDIISAQTEPQSGMINPQGGLLSQQPMMAMQSDMTQGDIDYFSPDAINARLSGRV